MRDQRPLSERIAADLSTVDWPAPQEIRARARRRTARTMLLVPTALVLVIVAGWTGSGVLGRGDRHVDRPTATLEPTSTLTPTLTPTATTTGGRSAELSDIIQLDALLQPEDLSPNYESATGQYRHVPGENTSWEFDLAECPGYAQLKVTTWRGYLYQVGHQYTREVPGYGTKSTGMQAERYPGRDAAQLVTDVHRVVAACPEYTVEELKPSSMKGYVDIRITHEILDTGFAGDSSVLVRSVSVPVLRSTGQVYGGTDVTLIAVVQVNDLVGVVRTNDLRPQDLITLTQRAVPRLCTAAKPLC